MPAVLDTHGGRCGGARPGPAIVKPNLAELAALAGRPLSPGQWTAAAGPAPTGRRAGGGRGELGGAEAVVVTLGPDGLLAATGDGCWRARPPAAMAGNATGAGDAVAAALAHGLVLGRPWDERLRHAAALGAATAAAPVAGEFRHAGLPRRAERGRGGGGPLMPLAAMGEIVGPARAAGRGVGAFNVIGIEHAEAIVTGAEAAGAPVVLQISENCAAYHGALEPIARACLAVARAAAVPVAVHLDHASSAELVRAASAFGLGSVMYDASGLPYAENVRATAEVAAWCHDRGVWVEAELGEIGGKNGVHSPLARTDPDQAAGFVAATGVDALAVAVGSSHAMLTRDAVLDLGLIARLRRAVGVPLVLHGSSGVPDAGPGRRDPGRDDEDQHRDPAEQGVHRRGPGLPVRRARGG